MYAQKINWGTLNRIPEICVDRFGAMSEVDEINWDKSRAFFLTHCDPGKKFAFFSYILNYFY